MYKMRSWIILCAILCLIGSSISMSRTQLKKTLQIMKKQCVPKIGVDEDKVANIEQGVFLEDRKVMCYIGCIYKTLQVTKRGIERPWDREEIIVIETIKNNKIDRDLVSKQVDILYPVDMRSGTKAGVDKCLPIQDNYDEFCEGVFYAAKCLYDYDPPNFVFP